MVNLIFKRLTSSLISLVGVILISFILLDLIPGSPVYEIIGSRADKDTIESLNKKLNIDKSLPEKFFGYFKNILTGNFGESFFTNEKVIDEILKRFPKTFYLAFGAMILSSLLGIFIGVMSAYFHNTFIDKSLISITLLGISTPVFWLGILFILLFSVKLQILPAGGYEDGDVRYLILPVLTLGIRPASFIARLTRSEMINVLTETYINTAKAKGLSVFTILFKHALKNVLIPVIQLIGMDIGTLLGGAALIEIVFNYPGIGYYGLKAIAQRDYPVILGVVVFSAVCFIIVNFIVDILNGFLNPRLKTE
ncbi:MAG: ABC transporter permease [Candidatus Hydrogenedentota bacterium]